jgi:hypothetical protein
MAETPSSAARGALRLAPGPDLSAVALVAAEGTRPPAPRLRRTGPVLDLHPRGAEVRRVAKSVRHHLKL